MRVVSSTDCPDGYRKVTDSDWTVVLEFYDTLFTDMFKWTKMSQIEEDIIRSNVITCAKELYNLYILDRKKCIESTESILLTGAACFSIAAAFDLSLDFEEDYITSVWVLEDIAKEFGHDLQELLRERIIYISKMTDHRFCRQSIRSQLNLPEDFDDILKLCSTEKAYRYNDLVIEYQGDNVYRCYTEAEYQKSITGAK